MSAHARALTTASAKASADCGFCPVTRLPETTTCDVQGSPLVYFPPLPVSPCSFEPLKGYLRAWLRCVASFFQRLPLTAQSFRTRVDRANGNSELRRTKGITNLVDCAGARVLNVLELAIKTLKNPSFAARCGHIATM